MIGKKAVGRQRRRIDEYHISLIIDYLTAHGVAPHHNILL